ncbi:MAG: hypothetical protein OWQ48_02000 [Desulfurococcus sp.]|nr:hypothetical protein [Desulfurococcus sp.]
MASSAVLNVEWGPYIMHELRAPDYTAALLGFTGMITSIIANLYWLRVDYSAYKRSLLILPLVPVAVVLVRSLPLHFGLNAIYAFAATGASLLASFLYADMSRKLGAFTSSLMTTIAFLSSQAVGLLTALAVFQAGTWATFLSATAYATLAVFTAFYSLPEVAVVPRDQALLHARRLHLVASSTFTVVVVASRRTIIVVLRTLAFTLALLILLFLYRLLYLLLIPM